jgi:hypothetical protein
MDHRRSFVSPVALLLVAITIGALLVSRSPTAIADEQRFQPFQFYAEKDVISDYGDARIDFTVSRNRVAVIEAISFHARNVQCTLGGAFLQTTLKEQNAIHTVVGVTDLGPSPSQVGRTFGLSQKIRAYSGPGTTVSILLFPVSIGSCPGDGLDLTVTGHYERP